MKCSAVKKSLCFYIEGGLTDKVRKRIEEHTAHCACCSTYNKELTRLLKKCSSLEEYTPSPEIWESIENNMEEIDRGMLINRMNRISVDGRRKRLLMRRRILTGTAAAAVLLFAVLLFYFLAEQGSGTKTGAGTSGTGTGMPDPAEAVEYRVLPERATVSEGTVYVIPCNNEILYIHTEHVTETGIIKNTYEF